MCKGQPPGIAGIFAGNLAYAYAAKDGGGPGACE
jgi:hypothetical protein